MNGTASPPVSLDDLAAIAKRLRRHVIKMTYFAGSGHPGGSLSAADMVAALYFHELLIDPARPDWPDRDRFIMSKGHACPVWYAALAERGFFPVSDLWGLRRSDSHLQGHPDMRKTPGVDMTSGPLGSGLAAGVGMALGARITGRDFRTFVMLGEGDLQEGCTWEAAMMAGFRKLTKLTVFVDYNRSQVDGRSDEIVSLDPLPDKWRAWNWDVREIDGRDLPQILEALAWAVAPRQKPAAILAHTVKGWPVSFMLDNHDWHGRAPNRDQAVAALAELGEAWDPMEAELKVRDSCHAERSEASRSAVETVRFGTQEPGDCHAERSEASRSAVETLRFAQSDSAARLRPERGEARPKRVLRDAFGAGLERLGAEFPNLVVLDADISSSLKTGAFRKRYPGRHVNFGVAEQEMFLAAAGLATTGLIPLACTYATFATLRAAEQVRSFIAYGRLNVKIIASHGGLEVGWDGPTHQAGEDIAMMRAIPNMTVVVPADATAVSALLPQIVTLDGPVYFRMGRNPVPILYDEDQPFSLGRAITVRQGGDVTLIACGPMVTLALDAAELLASGGIQARVLDMHTVKPLDGEAITRAAVDTGAIVTVEDHTILGGLGGAVAEHLAEHCPTPLVRVGIPDTFCRSGDPAELFPMYGMAVPDSVAAVHLVLSRKKTFQRSNV